MDSRRAPWIALPSVAAVMAAVTLVSRTQDANGITAGSLYLIAVLGLATWGGWAAGAAASVTASLCLNYFFLPPTGTLHVQDPSNWVALGCFLASSTLVSHLVARARRQADEAQGRQRELQVLYDLSFGLFTASQRPGGLGEAAGRTLRAIGSDAGVLVLEGNEPVSVIGETLDVKPELLDRARQSGLQESDGVLYIPLHVGEMVSGVLAASASRQPPAIRAVLEPAGRLLALAIERERLLREAAHLEAVRVSDALKTGLLRAVSHDLRTPLTSMRLELESLEGQLAGQPEALSRLRGLSVEQARLTRRIDNLLALARLEAGVARPHPEPTPAGSLLRAVEENLARMLSGRTVEVRVAPGCPDLEVDPSLMLEVLVNLLENAARASTEGLELAAVPSGESRVWVEVLDRGPGPPVAGYSASGGLGLIIARSLTEANGGTLALLERPGGGTIARLDLPASRHGFLETEELE